MLTGFSVSLSGDGTALAVGGCEDAALIGAVWLVVQAFSIAILRRWMISDIPYGTPDFFFLGFSPRMSQGSGSTDENLLEKDLLAKHFKVTELVPKDLLPF